MLRVVSPAAGTAPDTDPDPDTEQAPAVPLSRGLPKSRVRVDQPTLIEVFGDSVVDGGAAGFVMGQITAQLGSKPLVWVQDRLTRREAGRPCLTGLQQPPKVIHVDVSKPADLLWAMEEALRCGELGGVLGEVWGDPQVLDFTATKRLALRAEETGVPAWLIRRAAHPNLSAARERWRIKSIASLPHPYDPRAPGPAQWEATLFRARWRTPGAWAVQQNKAGGLTFAPLAPEADTDAAAAQV